VKYSDPSGHIVQVLFAVGFAAWSVYDGIKEYKKSKKAGLKGSKLALHMGGYIAKDIVIGKALKALKVGDRIVEIAQKVYKSKVITKTFAAVKSKIQPRLPKLNISNTSKGGSEVIFKSTDDAANLVAKNLDGTLSELKNGYKVEIPNGNKPIVIRIMNEGSGGRPNPYFRVSIDGKGSLTLDGTLSNDKALTHIDMTDDFLNQITDMIKKYQGK